MVVPMAVVPGPVELIVPVAVVVSVPGPVVVIVRAVRFGHSVNLSPRRPLRPGAAGKFR